MNLDAPPPHLHGPVESADDAPFGPPATPSGSAYREEAPADGSDPDYGAVAQLDDDGAGFVPPADLPGRDDDQDFASSSAAGGRRPDFASRFAVQEDDVAFGAAGWLSPESQDVDVSHVSDVPVNLPGPRRPAEQFRHVPPFMG